MPVRCTLGLLRTRQVFRSLLCEKKLCALAWCNLFSRIMQLLPQTNETDAFVGPGVGELMRQVLTEHKVPFRSITSPRGLPAQRKQRLNHCYELSMLTSRAPRGSERPGMFDTPGLSSQNPAWPRPSFRPRPERTDNRANLLQPALCEATFNYSTATCLRTHSAGKKRQCYKSEECCRCFLPESPTNAAASRRI